MSSTGHTYNYVQGLMYYFTNETISWKTGFKVGQETYIAQNGQNGLAEFADNSENWEKFATTKDELKTAMGTRSPTLPSVMGTASIALSPHTIPFFSMYENKPGTAGINFPDLDTPGKRAIVDTEGTIVPDKSALYRVKKINVTFVPLANEVDVANLDKDKAGDLVQQMRLKLMGKTAAPKPVEEKDKKKAKFSTRSTSSSSSDRNPTIETGPSVVYGSVVNTFKTGDENDDPNAPGYTPIGYIPSTFRGIYPQVISYVENPNIIWSMNYTDFLGGQRPYFRSFLDTLQIEIKEPKPIQIAKTISDTDTVKGRYADVWVSSADETVSFGSLVVTVPKEFRNVVSTYEQYVKDPSKPEEYELKPRIQNVGFCLISWEFEFMDK